MSIQTIHIRVTQPTDKPGEYLQVEATVDSDTLDAAVLPEQLIFSMVEKQRAELKAEARRRE